MSDANIKIIQNVAIELRSYCSLFIIYFHHVLLDDDYEFLENEL